MPLLIREKTPPYMKHDQLYKQLLHSLFQEFLEGFFPVVHDHLNFQSLHTLSEEMYTDLLKGESRRLDMVKKVKTRGTNTEIIVHMEPQSYVQRDFNARMYQYFSLLYTKYRKPVIPIAIFRYEESWEKKHFTQELPCLKILEFNYLTLHLKKIKNWRDYLVKDNPAVAALLSEMGYKKEERVEVKKEFLHMLYRLELDSASLRLVQGFFESYLKLTNEEEEQLMREIEKLPDADKIMELPISYEERGKELGKELGKEIGEEKGKKNVAFELLKKEMDVKLIAEVTGFAVEEIEEWKKELE